MKFGRVLCTTLAALVIFAAVSTASKAKDSKNILLRYDATIAGSHLASGQYAVEVQTHNPSATVSFSQGKKVVATVEGKVVDRGTKYSANQVVYGEGANGGHAIQEIRFKGSSEVVAFE
jgi:hypothetical protein